MTREQLDLFLKGKFGEDFDTSSITDEDIATLIGDTGNNDDGDDGDENGDNGNKDNTEPNNDSDDGNEPEDILDNINYDELSEDAKLMYKLFKQEKEARVADKIDNIISSSNLSDTQKSVVKRFAKSTTDIEVIKATIADLEKDNNASKRTISTSRMTGKNNVKSTIYTKQNTVPKFGTREYGAYLAKKKK